MYMNDRFKNELPNLHKWCEGYFKRTSMRISAGNPPYGLIMEDLLGQFEAMKAEIESLKQQLEAAKPKKKESK